MSSAFLRSALSFSRIVFPEKRKFLTQLLTKPSNSNPRHQNMSALGTELQRNKTLLTHNEITNHSDLNNLKQTSQIQQFQYRFVRNNLKDRVKEISYEANQQMEDRMISTQLISIQGYMVSVFDGHCGALVADYASNKITSLLEQFFQKNMHDFQNKDELIKQGLKSTYKQIEGNFYEDVYLEQLKLKNKKIKKMGTCALTVIIADNKIYTANCGDSQAIVVSNSMGTINYEKLNQRLSVNNPLQRQRLKAQFPEDHDIVVEEQKGCFYLKGRLQPTRTIGDYHLKKSQHWPGRDPFRGPYVSSQPEISVIPLKKQFLSIVIASDGIWDFIDKWSVSRIALQDNAHERIFTQTLKNISQLHNKTEDFIRELPTGLRRNYHDDISLAVVDLKNQFSQ